MLSVVVDDHLWVAHQSLKFGPLALRTTMTVLRLANGDLWVHSPITPVPALRAALETLGEVRHVVAPNRSHHLYFKPFLDAFPQARGYVAPGLVTKRPDLAAFAELTPATSNAWAPELHGVFVEGLPVLNETVWFHVESGALIVSDLLFRFGRTDPPLTRVAGRLLGVYGKVGMSRTMKAMVKDRAAFRRSVSTLVALPVRRLVLAHGDSVQIDGPTLARAFAGLDDERVR